VLIGGYRYSLQIIPSKTIERRDRPLMVAARKISVKLKKGNGDTIVGRAGPVATF
jgi:hypothetical protein